MEHQAAKNCAIYCRLSKEDEDKIQESESIQNQKNLLVGYAADQGWGVYHIYSDEDYSGVDAQRPAFHQMLTDAQAGKFQIVLCKTQSRFTRDIEMVERYIHTLFPLWGIRFIALLDNVDTAVKGNKKARQINGLINEWYLEDLSENIRAVFDQKRRAGRHIGSSAAYGYQKDPEDRGHLIVDDEAARVVKEIFRLYLEGKGTGAIARILNARGIPSPGAYKQAQNFAAADAATRAGSQGWNGTAVSRILRGEVYTGVLVQGTKRKLSYKSPRLVSLPRDQWIRVPNCHEALIQPEVFEAVQRRIARQTRSDGTGEIHWLSGMVYCRDCGAAMIKISHTYKGNRRMYLQCGRYAKDRRGSACTRHSIRLDRLTLAVNTRILQRLERDYRLGDPARFFSRESTGGAARALARELAGKRQAIARLAKATQSLYLDRVEGIITPETFTELYGGYAAEREALERTAASLEEQHRREQDRRGGNGREREVRRLLAGDPVPRALLEHLIDRVEIGEKDPQTGSQPVRVIWKI